MAIEPKTFTAAKPFSCGRAFAQGDDLDLAMVAHLRLLGCDDLITEHKPNKKEGDK